MRSLRGVLGGNWALVGLGGGLVAWGVVGGGVGVVSGLVQGCLAVSGTTPQWLVTADRPTRTYALAQVLCLLYYDLP